jgi:hypothetical protein
MSDHDDLYRYLAALERCSMEEIIEYLHGLEDDELGSFIGSCRESWCRHVSQLGTSG